MSVSHWILPPGRAPMPGTAAPLDRCSIFFPSLCSLGCWRPWRDASAPSLYPTKQPARRSFFSMDADQAGPSPLLFPVVAVLRRAASRSTPWPDPPAMDAAQEASTPLRAQLLSPMAQQQISMGAPSVLRQQKAPWRLPSSLLVCCYAVPVGACWVLDKMCSSPDVSARCRFAIL